LRLIGIRASALLLVTGLLQAGSGQTTDLGTAEPVFQQLSYGLDAARKLAVPLPWRLSAAGAERLEQICAGGGVMVSVAIRCRLTGGTGAPDRREAHRCAVGWRMVKDAATGWGGARVYHDPAAV
jgi:hypothetical protein